MNARDAAVRELIDGALSDDAIARHTLVRRIAPVVHQRVAQVVLRKRGSARGRVLRQEIEDLVQEVFVACFERDGRVLRAWDPDRGMSFENFIGLIAERETISILRTTKRSPWTEDPTPSLTLEDMSPHSIPLDARLESRSIVTAIADRMRERLTPLGMHYFRLMYLEQHTVQQIAEQCGTTTGALYVWRTRLSRLVHQIRGELEAEENGHGT